MVAKVVLRLQIIGNLRTSFRSLDVIPPIMLHRALPIHEVLRVVLPPHLWHGGIDISCHEHAVFLRVCARTRHTEGPRTPAYTYGLSSTKQLGMLSYQMGTTLNRQFAPEDCKLRHSFV